MDLHLTCTPHETLRLYVSGQLQAEIAVGVCDTRDTLTAEVHAARCLRALATRVRHLPDQLRAALDHPDHAHRAPQAQAAALLRGLLAGLACQTVAHPHGPLVPPVPPESSRTYARGYVLGEALARAQAGGEEDRL